MYHRVGIIYCFIIIYHNHYHYSCSVQSIVVIIFMKFKLQSLFVNSDGIITTIRSLQRISVSVFLYINTLIFHNIIINININIIIGICVFVYKYTTILYVNPLEMDLDELFSCFLIMRIVVFVVILILAGDSFTLNLVSIIIIMMIILVIIE